MSASAPAPKVQETTLSRASPMNRDKNTLPAMMAAATPIFCVVEKDKHYLNSVSLEIEIGGEG